MPPNIGRMQESLRVTAPSASAAAGLGNHARSQPEGRRGAVLAVVDVPGGIAIIYRLSSPMGILLAPALCVPGTAAQRVGAFFGGANMELSEFSGREKAIMACLGWFAKKMYNEDRGGRQNVVSMLDVRNDRGDKVAEDEELFDALPEHIDEDDNDLTVDEWVWALFDRYKDRFDE